MGQLELIVRVSDQDKAEMLTKILTFLDFVNSVEIMEDKPTTEIIFLPKIKRKRHNYLYSLNNEQFQITTINSDLQQYHFDCYDTQSLI
ncbi:hypothetical protein [Dolichospermum compactum]|uniref:Uncharacterized protein n=1 Tax=Dolichospermum compactum NIES-806 TaxID=1973481 RepID=A0A1Z4V969_9CYAN|nr:hypothetical protein [Dolichospermum compactum]BAZ88116.1 hypothetical protein NIES806_43500 [Dolichospermum compactum NIES-806]